MDTLRLNDHERNTLALICDTLIPNISSEAKKEFYARKATSLKIDRELERIVLSEFNEDQRAQFVRILHFFENRIQNLIFNQTLQKFSDMPQAKREEYLFRKLGLSKLGQKRTAFQAMKRIVCFTYYGLVTDSERFNPNWQDISYIGRPSTISPSSEESLLESAVVPKRDEVFECDVCIVGSGAGGSVTAESLTKLGWQVIVIDAGNYHPSADFQGKQEYELTQELFEQGGRAATKDLAFSLLEGHTVGGSTVVNWNTSIKPPDWLREEWETLDGISGLGTKEFDQCIDYIWSTLRVNRDESQLNPNNRVLAEGCENLGLSSPDDYDIIWRNAIGCQQKCDYCAFGCEYGAKQSTTRNFLLEAKRSGAKFIFGSEVETVTIKEGEASGVRAFVNASSTRFEVRSKAVVLAAGAINTPAILLRSGLRKNVGRNLKLHPTTAISGIYNEPIKMWTGPPQTVKVTKWLNLDDKHHGFWIEAVPGHPALYASALPWISGRDHKELMLKMPFSSGTIILVRESGSGRVRIDKHGRPVCEYSMNIQDKTTLKRGLVETSKILAASGARGLGTLHVDGLLIESASGSRLSSNDLDKFESEVNRRDVAPNKISMFSAHVMSSAGMGREQTSFCDAFSQSYEVPMLFIGDSSALPSSPGVNPMITIMSLARRNALSIHSILNRQYS